MLTRFLDIDQNISSRLRLDENRVALRRAAAFFAHSGDSWFWLAGLFLVWLFVRGEMRYLAALLAIAILIQAVCVLAIKFLIRRRRPQGDWGMLYRKTDPHSFPSGHAVRAVMLAVIAWQLGLYPLNVILTLWAPLVSIARVALGLHFLVDVVAGWLIGILLAIVTIQASSFIMALCPWVF